MIFIQMNFKNELSRLLQHGLLWPGAHVLRGKFKETSAHQEDPRLFASLIGFWVKLKKSSY